MAFESYFSAKEIGIRLGVTRRTVSRWIAAGRFSGVINLGTDERPALRVPESSIEGFLVSRAVRSVEVVRTKPVVFTVGEETKARTVGELRRKVAA